MPETPSVRHAEPTERPTRGAGRPGNGEHPRIGDPALQGLLAAIPAAIYTTDAAGYITYYNQAAAKLWGCEPALGVSQWCGSWRLYRADGTPLRHDQCPMAEALKSQRPVRGVEAVLERPDGTRVPFIPYPTPLLDSDGTITGAINMLVDISERQRADEVGQRLAAIVESSDDAIVSKDLNGIIVTWNHGAQQLFGYTADEVIGKPVNILIPEDRQNEEPGIIARIVRGERIDHYDTVRRRKDGSLVEISLTISPIRNSSGTIIGASKIARDISERKRAEERQKALVDELNHRVKNTLATVQSLAAQSIRGAGVSPRIRQSFEGRLFALSRTHDQLSRTQWETADLRSILDDIFAPYRQGDRSRVRAAGRAGASRAGRRADARHGAARACDQCHQVWLACRRRRHAQRQMVGRQWRTPAAPENRLVGKRRAAGAPADAPRLRQPAARPRHQPAARRRGGNCLRAGRRPLPDRNSTRASRRRGPCLIT